MTTTGQVLALNIATEAVLAGSFEHEDSILKATWRLRPLSTRAYQRDLRKLRTQDPQTRVFARLAARGELKSLFLERSSRDANLLRDLLDPKKAAEIPAEFIAQQLTGQVAAASSAIDAELDKMMQETDVLDLAEELETKTRELVAQHLVLGVSNVPGLRFFCENAHEWTIETGGVCPECGGAVEDKHPEPVTLDAEGAAALFEHPEVGDQLFGDILQALKRHDQERQEVLRLQEGN